MGQNSTRECTSEASNIPSQPEEKHESSPENDNASTTSSTMSCPAGVGVGNMQDPLVCEGYLRKIRGFGQNRTRWFRLTTTQLAYFSVDSGRVIAFCPREHITEIKDISARRFEIKTSRPFGASRARTMLLECRTPAIKTKWVKSLQPKTADAGFRARDGTLVVEGYLNKLKPFGVMNRVRWFTLTDKHLAYYTEEQGDLMAMCPLDQVESVVARGPTSFHISSTTPFTKSGAGALTLECESQEVRDKWMNQLRALLGARVQLNAFTPLSAAERGSEDHFGTFHSSRLPYDDEMSEGNRFIRNMDL